MIDDDKTISKTKREDVLDEACARFSSAWDEDKENRDNHLADFRFVYVPGSQYEPDLRARRDRWKLPSLEFNQLPQFIHQVVNDQRQNRPGIRVHAAGGDASDDVAEIFQGLVRGIEYDSQAESVYDTGFEGAVVGGRGWWFITSEYESMSFDQKICIKSIKDACNVVADNHYSAPDGHDRRFVFVIERMPKSEFMRRWPKADQVDWEGLSTEWSDGTDGAEDCITVADYYRRLCEDKTLVMMSDGAIGWLDDMPPPPAGVVEVARRQAEKHSVEWFKVAGGQQILEEYECPGEVIPAICCPGTEALIDGERIFQGLIRNARDPQRMLNYGMTSQAIHLAMTPLPPWIVAEGQVDNYKKLWANANTEYFAYLPYTPTSIEGVPVPPPQRIAPSSPDAGWLNWTMQMQGMIKSTVGMYENSLGLRSNEQSGVAIKQREMQGDNATFHFVDNLSRAIALTGRIVVSWIPKIYDAQRIVHLIGMDDERKPVVLNQQSMGRDQSGAIKAITLNDVTKGKYAVTVEAGPTNATKRQDSAARLADMVKAYPPLMQVAGDLVMKAQDIPDSGEFAERLEFTLPPPIQQAMAAKKKGGKPPDPQMMQAMQQKDQQLQQIGQAMQAMQAELQQAKSGAQEKMAIAQMDQKIEVQRMQSEGEMAIQKARQDSVVTLQKAQIDAETDLQKAQIEQQTALTKAKIDQNTRMQIARLEAHIETQRIEVEDQRIAVENERTEDQT